MKSVFTPGDEEGGTLTQTGESGEKTSGNGGCKTFCHGSFKKESTVSHSYFPQQVQFKISPSLQHPPAHRSLLFSHFPPEYLVAPRYSILSVCFGVSLLAFQRRRRAGILTPNQCYLRALPIFFGVCIHAPSGFLLQVARHALRKPALLYPNTRVKKKKNTRKELLLRSAGSASLALLPTCFDLR